MGFNNVEKVLSCSQSTGTARAVLIVLAHRANDKTGACFPSIRLVASDAGISARGAKKAINKLVEMGELLRESRKGSLLTRGGMQRSNLYRITLKGGERSSLPMIAKVVNHVPEGGEQYSPKVVNHVPKGGELRSPITRREQQEEQKERRGSNSPTRENVHEIANKIGMSTHDADAFFYHYDAQDWRRGNGQRITSVESALEQWRRTERDHREKNKIHKTRLDQ